MGEVTQFKDDLLTICGSFDGILLLADLELDKSAPRAFIDPQQFLTVLKAAKPRVVYLSLAEFDPDAEIEDALGLDSDQMKNEHISEDPKLKTLRKRWEKYRNELSMCIGHFFVDGVAHTSLVEEQWSLEFSDTLSEAKQSVSEKVEDIRKHESRAANFPSWVDELAVQIADHPAFISVKASKEKRLYLAEVLFPDKEHYELYRIVDRATNIAWLRDQTKG
jgi:hypothetical protein